MQISSFVAVLCIIALLAAGCAKKRFEDTDTYRELMRKQEEMERKADSIKSENYKEIMDSASVHRKRLDSLKHITDSLQHQLEKNIQDLKNKK